MKNFFYLLAFFLIVASKASAYDYKTFKVTDYGANPNDAVDDVPAIDSAVASANTWIGNQPYRIAIILFPASGKGFYLIGRYTEKKSEYLNNYSILLRSNIAFKGENKNNTIIKLADNMFTYRNKNGDKRTSNIFYGKNVSNISFSDLTFDMNGINNLNMPDDPNISNDKRVQTNLVIKIEGDENNSNLKFENIIIKNNAGHNDIGIYGNGKGVSVINSSFINGGWNVGSPVIANSNNKDFSFLYSEWDNAVFENDSLIQENPSIALLWYSGGIEIHGSNSKITGTYIYGCNPAIYIASERYNTLTYTLENITVKNTKMLRCVNGINFWVVNHINNVAIQNNFIQLTAPPQESKLFTKGKDYYAAGILVPNGNAPGYSNYSRTFVYGTEINANSDSLSNILIRSNIINSEAPETIHNFMTTGIKIHSLKNSIIDSNTIEQMNYAGILLQASAWGMNNLAIVRNTIGDFRRNYNTNVVSGYIVATDTYRPDANQYKKKPAFRHISICNNTFNSNSADVDAANGCTGTAKKYACFKGMFFALPVWYAYTFKKDSYIMKASVFSIYNNKINNNTANESITLVPQN